MAIVSTHLTTSRTNNTQSTFTTASISPASNNLVLAFIFSFNLNTVVPALSGGGMTTWDLVTSIVHGDTFGRVFIFRALQASPSSGILTIDFSPSVASACDWSISEFSGVSLTGTNGSGAIAQSGSNASTGTLSSGIVTLNPFKYSTNASFGGINKRNNTTINAGSGFTELGHINGFNDWTQTEYQISNDNTVDWSWASESTSYGALAVEIQGAITSSFFLPILMKRFN